MVLYIWMANILKIMEKQKKYVYRKLYVMEQKDWI